MITVNVVDTGGVMISGSAGGGGDGDLNSIQLNW